MESMTNCILDNCTREIAQRGLCAKHSAYHRYHGTYESVALPKMVAHRLSDLNTTMLTATCEKCGPVKVVSNGKRPNGTDVWICQVKSQAKWRTRPTSVYFFGDGQSIDMEIAETFRKKFYEEQNGKCAICDRHENEVGTLCLDHCHETGRLRGLLCKGCNIGLGFFKDSADNLLSASNYLTR